MRVPAHAAVAATVDLAGATVGARVRGLVNALLRKVAARDFEEWAEQLTAGSDRLTTLGIRHAHPRWIVDAYAERLPADELEAALAANNLNPATSLAALPGLVEVAELVAAGAEPGRWSPFAASWAGNPADVAAVSEGRAGVQDEGSQLLAWALTRSAAEPGRWLDVCAGPGGKSALLAGMAAADDSRLVSADVSPHRAKLVKAALRAYSGPAAVVVADGTRPSWRAASFTRVLADVPCTGLGALRRRPESRWRRRGADVDDLHRLQVRLLHGALDAAVPGGVVGYLTCSPHRRETVEVVTEVLAGRSDVEIEDGASLLPDVPGASLGPYVQLWTHRHGTDAMFGAYLRRH
jgi:16S rRNA (cytosine967-C5)-methyltransferase